MDPKNYLRAGFIALIAFLLVCLTLRNESASASTVGQDAVPGWSAPLPGPIIRLFQRPETKFSAGHRGVDIPALEDEPVLAPSAGLVTFVGLVFDRTAVVITHPNGIQSEVEPICPSVIPGEPVMQGEPIGVFCLPETTYAVHCLGVPCLHFSIRKEGEYFSPQVLIGGLSPTRLKPW